MPRFLSVTETDPNFRARFTAHLLSQGAVPVLFELPPEFPEEDFPGARVFQSESPAQALETARPAAPAQAQGPSWHESHKAEIDWLNAYKGDFPFYLSLRDQLTRNGALSEKQVDAIKRAIDRDKARPAPVQPQDFTLKAGGSLLLSRFIAEQIARSMGRDHAFRLVDVLEVKQETEKAYLIRLRLSARRTPVCGICGQELTNPDSQAAGIGPICADNWGLPYGEASLEGLDAQLRGVGETTAWVPKRSILERFDSPTSANPERK